MMTSRLAASVIVHDQDTDRVVTIHYAARSWNPGPAWTTPGGKVDPGEPADRAAARELLEETGLIVDLADLRLVHVIHVAEGWDGLGDFVLFVFAATRWTGDLVNNEPTKHISVGWSDLHDLPEPMFPTSAAAIAAYRDGGPLFAASGWPVSETREGATA